MTSRAGFAHRGVNYDTGIRYTEGHITLPVWDLPGLRQDMEVIHRELNCDSVMLLGSDVDRLAAAAELAGQTGLKVWIQPRAIDASRNETLSQLRDAAQAAEKLRSSGLQVSLVLGCELTIFMPGLMPGRGWGIRAKLLAVLWPLLAVFNARLNRFLKHAQSEIRPIFSGPVTYASGSWERVNWSGFDLIGVNLYRDRSNETTYRQTLRSLRQQGKPLVITEFGCCCYEGAQHKGGGGHEIIDWYREPPSLKGNPKRSERVQAEHLARLIGIFEEEGVDGAFVYVFNEPSNPYSPDPSQDLDTASYGIVKVLPVEEGEPIRWEPKQAFQTVSELFGR